MSLSRLRQRVPGARVIGCYFLDGYDLRFHKAGQDSSAKCDLFYTGSDDRIYGVVFDIPRSEKPALDRAEGLGVGYAEKVVTLQNQRGDRVSALTYFALQIDPLLKPYDWYVNHVLVGAREAGLPSEYTDRIGQVETVPDADIDRDARERALHIRAQG